MDKPPLFRALSLEAAQAAARAEGKCLLLDVTGEHCPPCHQMDRTTWRDPEVERWVEQRAVAVQLDQGDPALGAFTIMAVPTLFLFRDGRELDRVTGARPARELLEWLDRAVAGKTELDRLRGAEPRDLMGRMRLGHELMLRGLFDEATRELAWLWEHSLEVDPEFAGVRASFLASELGMLVATHPPAREQFSRLRDAAEQRLPDKLALLDWIGLCQVLGDEPRILAWFDRVKASPPPGLALHSDPRILEILERHERWADLGRLVPDPAAMLREEHDTLVEMTRQLPPGAPAEMMAQAASYLHENLRRRAASLCRAMRAAGRAQEATATEAQARALDPSPEMDAALRGAA